MTTQIDQDASAVLKALAEWVESPNDESIGRYQVSGAELSDKLNIGPGRINDAVEHLEELGFVAYSGRISTHPYTFWDVWLEAAGRLEYQKSLEISNLPAALTPAGNLSFDVFLSHSSLDDELAAAVKSLLDEWNLCVCNSRQYTLWGLGTADRVGLTEL